MSRQALDQVEEPVGKGYHSDRNWFSNNEKTGVAFIDVTAAHYIVWYIFILKNMSPLGIQECEYCFVIDTYEKCLEIPQVEISKKCTPSGFSQDSLQSD